MNSLEVLFVVTAFLFQLVLVVHFSLRKWRFEQAIRLGKFVYALSLAAVAVSIILLCGGMPWTFWIGGFLYLVWAAFGFYVEYIRKIEWRNSRRWSILVPYITLYLATVMFYWWPLALIQKWLWYGYAGLFVITTFLNITSHKKS